MVEVNESNYLWVDAEDFIRAIDNGFRVGQLCPTAKYTFSGRGRKEAEIYNVISENPGRWVLHSELTKRVGRNGYTSKHLEGLVSKGHILYRTEIGENGKRVKMYCVPSPTPREEQALTMTVEKGVIKIIEDGRGYTTSEVARKLRTTATHVHRYLKKAGAVKKGGRFGKWYPGANHDTH